MKTPLQEPTRSTKEGEYLLLNRFPVERRTVLSRDGVRIHYEVVGKGEVAVVLANGLGGRLYAWVPIVEKLYDQYRFITWDYRGLYESESPSHLRRLAVDNHAEDIRDILEDQKVEKAHLIGWSMGVQVILEFANIYPEKVLSLTLLNGTYGHIFSTAFQPIPFLRFPWSTNLIHRLLESLAKRDTLIRLGAHLAQKYDHWIYRSVQFFSPKAHPILKEAVRQYMRDIFATNFKNYLRLFQELDAHSVYHHLPEIPHPTLIIGGALDILTPAYQAREMKRRLPSSRLKIFPTGTHYVLIERYQEVVPLITSHLNQYTPPR